MNMFMADLLRPVSGIPIAERSIDMFNKWNFRVPTACENFEVCLLDSDVDAIESLHGKLVRTSPDEQLMAFFRACANDIKDNKNVQGWSTAILTCSCTFRVVANEAAMWARASQIRDNATELRDAIGMTGFQRIHDIINLYKTLGQKVTPEKLAEEYNKSIEAHGWGRWIPQDNERRTSSGTCNKPTAVLEVRLVLKLDDSLGFQSCPAVLQHMIVNVLDVWVGSAKLWLSRS